MFSPRMSSAEVMRRFLTEQAKLDLTYPAVGATATTPPAGYVVDRTRVKLGEGEMVFAAAKEALQSWRQLDLGWLQIWPPDAPVQDGEVVALIVRAVGLWWLNASRVVYTVDESDPIARCGFAYGTLPAHVESGEERFLIEWDRSSGSVWYDILAFSRPRHFLARLGYPMVRRMQKRFARESAAAMLAAVSKIVPG